MYRKRRRRAGSWSSSPCRQRIQTALNQALVGATVDVLVDAASRRRETELSGRTSQNVVVNLPGPPDVDWPCSGGEGRARRRAQCVGQGGIYNLKL